MNQADRSVGKTGAQGRRDAETKKMKEWSARCAKAKGQDCPRDRGKCKAGRSGSARESIVWTVTGNGVDKSRIRIRIILNRLEG